MVFQNRGKIVKICGLAGQEVSDLCGPAASMDSRMSPAVVQAQRSFCQRGTASSKEEFFDANEDFSESQQDVEGHCDFSQSLEAGGGNRALQHMEQKVQMVAPSAAHSPGVGLAEANASVRIHSATSSCPRPVQLSMPARARTHAHTHTHTHTRTCILHTYCNLT